MVPSTGMSTPSVTTVSGAFSQRGMRAKYRRKIEAWKSMKTTMERGNLTTPSAVTASSTATRIVAGTGRSSGDLINSALAIYSALGSHRRFLPRTATLSCLRDQPSPRLAPASGRRSTRRAGSVSARTFQLSPHRSPRLRLVGSVSARTSGPLPDDLAEDALGPEDQDEDQDREGEDVLVLGAEGPTRQQGEVGGRERLEQTQHEPAEHGPRDVPDAPEHGRGEGLEPRDEARVRVDEAVLDAEEHARPATHGPADQEGQRDHAIDVDAHEAGRGLVLGDGADGLADLRPVDEGIQAPEHEERGHDDHERLHGDVDGLGQLEAVIERVHGRVDEVEGIAPDRLHEADGVLEEEGDADGGDERDQAGSVAERTVGRAFDDDGEKPRGGHAHEQSEERRVGREC